MSAATEQMLDLDHPRPSGIKHLQIGQLRYVAVLVDFNKRRLSAVKFVPGYVPRR